MKIAIAGKNDIAVNALEFLHKNYPFQEIVVVCNKNETGKNSWQKSLRYFAQNYHIQEVSLESLYEEEELLFLSLEFDQIIKPSYFRSNRLFNIHFSLLPQYKGMFTSVMPILNNESYSGVTLHQIDTGIDTGDILAQKKFEILFNDTASTLYQKYLYYAYLLFVENIDLLIRNPETLFGIPQSQINSSYYSKRVIDFGNINIDLRQTALSIHNQIRAFHFRVYQLAQVFGKNIVHAIITQKRSVALAGTLLFETQNCMMISTIDYDVILIKDSFPLLIDACCKGDKMNIICTIPYMEFVVNEKDEHGCTPLIVATYHGHLEVVQYLLMMGANTDCVDYNGTTLLMYAKDCFLKTGNAKIFEFLYALGLDYKQKDYTGKTLYDHCIKDKISRIGNILVDDFKTVNQ